MRGERRPLEEGRNGARLEAWGGVKRRTCMLRAFFLKRLLRESFFRVRLVMGVFFCVCDCFGGGSGKGKGLGIMEFYISWLGLRLVTMRIFWVL